MDAIAGCAQPPNHATGGRSARPRLRVWPPDFPARGSVKDHCRHSGKPCHSGDMETLRWQVGDATVFGVPELDATPALQGLIPKFDRADVSRTGWLIPDFVDEAGRLHGLVQVFLIF